MSGHLLCVGVPANKSVTYRGQNVMDVEKGFQLRHFMPRGLTLGFYIYVHKHLYNILEKVKPKIAY